MCDNYLYIMSLKYKCLCKSSWIISQHALFEFCVNMCTVYWHLLKTENKLFPSIQIQLQYESKQIVLNVNIYGSRNKLIFLKLKLNEGKQCRKINELMLVLKDRWRKTQKEKTEFSDPSVDHLGRWIRYFETFYYFVY